ncbi:MAG: undecaprenyl/decaprenyl-phosphate alpha-N-acetylglucosaminyl 1-phosphate transferase [Planctomycetaceae bacterium]|jgi:UDP-GlcNAc:undecaprenyl-phosphate GlcNAc-1-phosphate transferase|nr:undecaprenyl/decaprenyl-phosphate alpha-N-acetylglucosaminyl 1-phosphate transferase [Planctomycetaceae bacterium]
MIFVFVVGFLISSFLCRWICRFAERLGLVDKPGRRKIHEKPTPTDGGLAIWLAIVAPLAVGQLILWALVWERSDGENFFRLPQFIEIHLSGLLQQSQKLWQLLGLGTVLVFLGLWDDLRGLNWKFRIAVQFCVAMAIVSLGWRASLFIDAPVITYWLSVFWVVGLINSFNMLDNMDGLSAGVASICAAFFSLIMLSQPLPATNQPQIFLGGLMLLILGAILGFLRHNLPPAKLFMGDSGAYFIGYLLATSTLSATYAGYETPRQTIFVPMVLLAAPIYDVVSVVAIRLKEKRSPFVGDKSHFSHRLVELGFTKPQAVCVVYLVTAICCLGALLLYHATFFGAVIIFLQTVLILILIAILETKRKK